MFDQPLQVESLTKEMMPEAVHIRAAKRRFVFAVVVVVVGILMQNSYIYIYTYIYIYIYHSSYIRYTHI